MVCVTPEHVYVSVKQLLLRVCLDDHDTCKAVEQSSEMSTSKSVMVRRVLYCTEILSLCSIHCSYRLTLHSALTEVLDRQIMNSEMDQMSKMPAFFVSVQFNLVQ